MCIYAFIKLNKQHSTSLLIKSFSLRTSIMVIYTFTVEVIFRNHFIRNATTQTKKVTQCQL